LRDGRIDGGTATRGHSAGESPPGSSLPTSESPEPSGSFREGGL
jgi:hypothetical protein